MKYLFCIILIYLSFGCKSKQNTQVEEINVLFIGNSLTYYSNMPQMLQQMVNETHSNIKIHQSTFPGYGLDAHFGRKFIKSTSNERIADSIKSGTILTETIKKIKEQSWDFIVLQTGTVSVLIPEARDISIQKSILATKSLIDNPNCKFILFSTWASKTEYPKQYCYDSIFINNSIEKDDCCSPKIENLEQHIELINSAYKILADNNKLVKSDHTNKALEMRTKYPTVSIYDDDIHPNKNGSFLNACIFYQLLTTKKANKLKYTGNIELKTAEILKSIVN